MAWLVENLVRNSSTLKSKSDPESDEYNNLLIIECKINELYKLNILTQREMIILQDLSNGATTNDLVVRFSSNRITIAKDIKKICELIAYYLGGEFTDEGYLNYMQEKYELTNEEIRSLREYMNGKHSRRLMRRRNNVKTI